MVEGGYQGREQALVKHTVLRSYLQTLALKVGQFQSGTTLNYIDGFSGPWDAVRDDDGDSSPAIAARELDAARRVLEDGGKRMRVRCMFVEKDPAAFGRLGALCARVPVQDTVPIHGEFEDHIAEAVSFAEHGPHPFAFVFIDPTGWSGYGLQAIAPLLRVEPSEVLINFMLKDILRFIDHGTSVALPSFEALFGQRSAEYRKNWKGLAGLNREDAIVTAYCERIRDAGRFPYCVSTIVLNPTADRTQYRLVFATRSRKGLTTFRNIERKALSQQQEARAGAKQAEQETRTGQLGLLEPADMDTNYFSSLLGRYRGQARAAVGDALPPGVAVPYEGAGRRSAVVPDDLRSRPEGLAEGMEEARLGRARRARAAATSSTAGCWPSAPPERASPRMSRHRRRAAQ